MDTRKNRVRTAIVVLTIAIVIMNGGMFYIVAGFPSRSVDPSQLEGIIAKIESGEIEVTKQRYLASVSNMKRYAEASERMIETLQKFIALLAISNVVVVLAAVGMLWGATRNREPTNDA